nr:twin-arginine translocation signal domain-containing protein [Pseudomonadales bacterium]
MQSFYATRRGFLRGTAIGALGLALDLKTLRPVFADARLPPGAREYTGYRDVYRRKWSWDRIGVGTHSCTNCASGGCSWNLYVRDGIVWREEQGAPYAQT